VHPAREEFKSPLDTHLCPKRHPGSASARIELVAPGSASSGGRSGTATDAEEAPVRNPEPPLQCGELGRETGCSHAHRRPSTTLGWAA
jgi:hypothetical protein